MKKDARILALIKPQFEVGRQHVGKKGVVRDPALHAHVIKELIVFFAAMRLTQEFVIPSPILGPKGNKEFFISLKFESST
jgi:23S rRNA (cytidine1920-2'-O)/16S rRNA (cytidine1409-2'-O)-methyltransferase